MQSLTDIQNAPKSQRLLFPKPAPEIFKEGLFVLQSHHDLESYIAREGGSRVLEKDVSRFLQNGR